MPGFASRVLLLVCILLVVPHPGAGTCTNPTIIQNLHVVSYTPTGVVLAWDAPSGYGGGTQYDVLQESASNYCSFTQYHLEPIASASSTTATITGLLPDYAYGFSVRIKNDYCSWSANELTFDTYTTPPAKPVITRALAGPNGASVQFSYSDTRTASIAVERAPAGGAYSYVYLFNACSTNPKTFNDTGLAPGAYLYRLATGNMATDGFKNAVRSDPVSVTVGNAPAVLSFSATPSTIRPGQSAVLSFMTSGATSVVLDQGLGAQATSGSVTVTPAATTTYRLTAMNGSFTATATAMVTVLAAPSVVISALPAPILQLAGSGGGKTSYSVTNTGGASTTVSLLQTGTFFTQSPTSFTLAAGASQAVTVTGSAQSAGTFGGTVSIAGIGVPADLMLGIQLLSSPAPTGVPKAQPLSTRVDVSAPGGGVVYSNTAFTNTGTGTITGILSSDVPWLVPGGGMLNIAPGQTVQVSFVLDRDKRIDAGATIGSACGNLSLSYFTTSGSYLTIGGAAAATPAVSVVSVVDTIKPVVTSGAPTPLAAGELALFVPGVGHVLGSVGLFVSDLSLLNVVGSRSITDLRFHYTPLAGTNQKTAAVGTLGPNAVSVADVVKSVFGSDAEVGSLQIRSADAAKLVVSTKVFNASNPAGTYGTMIPTFRSDRAAGAGESVYLVGLRRGATSHSNVFIQETSGKSVTVKTDFLTASGATVASRSDTIAPFALTQLNNVVPAGAVSAILTNTGEQPGRFLGYATPVDDASGDNWSVVDWSRQNGYAGTTPVIIPIAGAVHGANNTFFRTDVAVMNSSTSQASATMRYVGRSGEKVDRQITLSPRQTMTYDDIIGSFFGISTDTAGYVLLTPVTGTFEVTSRTYTTVAGKPATFGTGVPTLAVSEAMKNGGVRIIGALEDSCNATIMAGRGATFRTNFALVEIGGSAIRVRVTLRYTFSGGSLATAFGTSSKEYVLGPGQFSMLNGIGGEVVGMARESAGDLRAIDATFQIVAGDGALIVFTSSVDNGTGDSILRVE